MRKIDLHVHTNISDGSETPENAVRIASDAGLSAIAITDHDTAAGVSRAQKAGEEYGLEVIAGMELGCGWYGREVHMLGYFIDPDAECLKKALDWIVDDREQRNRRMAAMMTADGIKVDVDELKQKHPGAILGRPHFALCLIEQGYAISVSEAFHKYLDPGRKYYIRRNFLSVEEAANLIQRAGGKPVIAHPGQYRLSDEGMTELMERGSKAGVVGLECYYSGYAPEQVAEYLAIAKKYGLTPTGGSDWHGKNKTDIRLGSGKHGELNIPYEILENLKIR